MRKTCIMTAALLALSALVSAQDSHKLSPALPAEILGPPLVVWSEVQQPRPIPAGFPSAKNGTSDDRANLQSGQPVDSQPEQPSAQTFTGTVAKDGSQYILTISANLAYRLDDQEKIKDYAGKLVRIAGKLDAKDNTLYIKNIEPLS